MRRLQMLRAAELDALRLIDSLLLVGAEAAAARLLARLRDEIARIASAPDANPQGPDASLRQRVFRFGRSRYVIRYRVTDDAIVITRIWHGKQDRPGTE
ncbi:MAG: type II toxin-antitoxin system RelE/ParE family toxin [Alphaproteobacteria bacterium]|nr:type II toxin-antitoxin system RelE/ParE family toxin [Alphaproteobacteria bacterium]